jgi:DNA-binding protein H-NS
MASGESYRSEIDLNPDPACCYNPAFLWRNSMAMQPNARLDKLREQLAKVQGQVAKQEEARRKGALEQISSLMAQYGLTIADIDTKGKRGPAKKESKSVAKKRVAAKYQDPKTGATWSGRGREPLWIKGKKRDRFVIAH